MGLKDLLLYVVTENLCYIKCKPNCKTLAKVSFVEVVTNGETLTPKKLEIYTIQI